MTKKVLYITVCIMIFSLLFTACGGSGSVNQLDKPAKGEQIAVIKTTMGDIKVKFFPQVAPKAVENFIKHAQDGYYNGVIFHRVMNDFMIQGGDPLGTGTGGESIWGKAFEDEFSDKLHNFRGALSMANSGPSTNGSQFFIVQKGKPDINTLQYMRTQLQMKEELIDQYKEYGGTPWLDNAHTVFGQVFEGMDVVDKIAAVKTNKEAKPLEDVKITSISIEVME